MEIETSTEEHTMTTTTVTTYDYRVPAEYYGDQFDRIDTAAVDADVLDALNDLLPEGIRLAANGDVIADVDMADEAREIDWAELVANVAIDDVIAEHTR